MSKLFGKQTKKLILNYMKSYYESSYPHPLSAEEERKCLLEMQQGSESAKESLILHNMRLVAYVAQKFLQHEIVDDLISIGYFGLVKGLNTFKMEKNIRLSTYLIKCIENEILMHLRHIKRHEKCVSLETVLSKDKYGKEFKLESILADESDCDFEKTTDSFINKDQISKLIPCLNDLERKVIILRYGLKDGIVRSQTEVGPMLGVSRSYISRIENNALNKMRDELTYSERFKENHTNF